MASLLKYYNIEASTNIYKGISDNKMLEIIHGLIRKNTIIIIYGLRSIKLQNRHRYACIVNNLEVQFFLSLAFFSNKQDILKAIHSFFP